ncbi:M23 family metallopeptidase [Paraburkholderia sp. BL21I4N1]|uniref:M23 family metallopeptidase n=1 Tax=Paraburkholderia sp. BL21I4N1 TaxID=1938801 RepID=UPI000D4A80BD|nr:M23 family metallopeptidase [Paraburkholderia sp. BL21I4N1]PQV48092.1 putative chitinase [Paraburkholderia sp. BL21I4N1]
MIISPPFLPQIQVPANSTAEDPLMDEIDKWIDHGGRYPIAFDRRWHTGLHLRPSNRTVPVHAIADGEVVAYRVCSDPLPDSFDNKNTNGGFVLLKHATETGEGRSLIFYSLYMHLLDNTGITQTGIHPPAANQVHGMADWLRQPTGGPMSGGNKKVLRKDVLGYVGRCQDGPWHLHFEIFTTGTDFNKYFGMTQPGQIGIATPSGNDCWGHSYYFVPAGQTFLPQPPGVDAHGYLHGIAFPRKQGGQSAQSLYVEMYFYKGDKYTNVWSVASDGSRTLLTVDKPDCETNFELDMFKRATALYAGCASDGYELLRFGRVISHSQTAASSSGQTPPPVAPELLGNPHPLSASNPLATWHCIQFATGQYGYIDANRPVIQKLSDADFPFFRGWKKIQASTDGLFDQHGLWDLEKLKALVCASIGGVSSPGTLAPAISQTPQQQGAAMEQYLSDPHNKAVQELLQGFICEAPSEWDRTNTDDRYRHLLDAGEHFEGNQRAYEQFKSFVGDLQFWDKTSLRPGDKVWFFHPLAFIRHFRRCPWLTLKEQAQLLPRQSIADAGGNIPWNISKRRFSEGASSQNGTFPANIWVSLNKMWVKYGFVSSLRRSHFLGQVFKETGAFNYASEWGDAEYFRKMYEVYTTTEAASDFDHKRPWLQTMGFLQGRDRPTYIAQRPGEIRHKAESNGNVISGDGARFRGRGLIHLTWRNGYRDYGSFCGRDFESDPNPELLQNDANVAADSAGYFWVMKRINRKADHGSDNADVLACFRLVGGAGGLAARQQFFRYTYFMLNDSPTMPADSQLAVQVEV